MEYWDLVLSVIMGMVAVYYFVRTGRTLREVRRNMANGRDSDEVKSDSKYTQKGETYSG